MTASQGDIENQLKLIPCQPCFLDIGIEVFFSPRNHYFLADVGEETKKASNHIQIKKAWFQERDDSKKNFVLKKTSKYSSKKKQHL